MTNDYVTLLCRQKKVSGTLLGRMWYVDPESLQKFLAKSKLEREARRAELSRQLKTEYQKAAPVANISTTEPEAPPAAPLRERSETPKKNIFISPRFATAAFAFFIIGTFGAQAFAGGGAGPFAGAHPLAFAWQPIERPIANIPDDLTQKIFGPSLQQVADALAWGLETAPTPPQLPASAQEVRTPGVVASAAANLRHALALAPERLQTASALSSVGDTLCVIASWFSVSACGNDAPEPELAEVTPPPTSSPTPAPTITQPQSQPLTQPVAPTPQAQPIYITKASPAPLTNTYVTQNVFDSTINSLRSLIASYQPPQTAVIPPYIAAGGNIGVSAGATLDGVTVINNITNGSSATALAALTDVSVSSPAWGQLFMYNGSAWTAVATSSLGIAGASSVATLSDITLTTPAWGNMLVYNGTKWVNMATSTLGIGSNLTFGYPLLNNTNNISLAFGTTTANVWSANQSFLSSIAVGTSSPYARLTVWGGDTSATSKAFEIANSASTSILTVSNAGLFSVGNNGSNAFTVDASTGSTTIANLSIGNLNFDTNAGVVALSNIPVDANAAAGVIQSQSINIGDTSVLTVYGESDGAGNVQNLRVGIGTTSPYSTLSVVGNILGSSFTSLSNATSTFTGPIKASCFSLDGNTCITSGSGSSFSYLFPAGATSSPLMLLASTTIGNGTQRGGLTISGGATTTGNAYFLGNVAVGTTTTSLGRLTVGSGPGDSIVTIDSPSGNYSVVRFSNATVSQWEVGDRRRQ